MYIGVYFLQQMLAETKKMWVIVYQEYKMGKSQLMREF